MSTFTIRDGKTTCDHCGLRVGKGWRAMHGHICPRVVADPCARVCAGCGTGIRHKPKGQVFCTKSCASSHRKVKVS